MKIKQGIKVIGLTMNTGEMYSAKFTNDVDRTIINIIMNPLIESCGGCIPDHEDWKVAIIKHDGFAICYLHYKDKALIATNYVAWTKIGSLKAWKIVNAAHNEQSKRWIAMGIHESTFRRTKPPSEKWISTLLDSLPWDNEVQGVIGEISTFMLRLAMSIIDLNSPRKIADRGQTETKQLRQTGIAARNGGELT